MEPIPKATLFHHPFTTNAPLNFKLNQEDEEKEKDMKAILIVKEAMFEKPLTPSDVGKLNRLVIPKQHAEKYFPLGGNNGGCDTVEKELLLSFDDESGKKWRFRYSYWNSSQSYVLTKGWSRFVKEKRLDAGDIVVFERYRTEGERFLIGWKRRNVAVPLPESMMVGGSGGWNQVYYSGHPYSTRPNGPSLPIRTRSINAGGGGEGAGGLQNQTTQSGNSKTVLRLFGVNLECHEPTARADGLSQSEVQETSYYTTNHHIHMDEMRHIEMTEPSDLSSINIVAHQMNWR